MAGYDDPRFLQQKIERLEKDLEALRKATLGFAANQKGALPGAMRAVSLNDRGQSSSMFMDFRNLGPGLGPYGAVTDAAGTIRAEWGNLAVNGVSPAQIGFRANSGTGTPIFDSLGLISVMQELGHVDAGSSYTNTTTTFTVIPGTAVTFSLTRQLRILSLMSCFGSSLSQTGGVVPFIDGVNQSATWPQMTWGGGAVGDPGSTAVSYLSTSLAAGSHTIDLRGNVAATPATLSIFNFDVIVWQLGS